MEPDQKIHEPSLLRRYLLGELTESEQQDVEGDLFTQDDFADRLASVEDDLIDSYVAGELSEHEHEHFQSHFLTSPRRRERVATARALAQSPQALARQPGRSASKVLEFGGRREVRRTRPAASWAWPMAAAASIVILGGASFLAMNALLSPQRTEVSRLTQQVERLRAEVSSRPPASAPDKETLLAELRKTLDRDSRSGAAAPLEFVVPPSDLRRNSGGLPTRLVVPGGQHTVQLRLALDPATTAKRYAVYQAVIQTSEGAQIWGGKATREPGTGGLRITVPSAALKGGQYRLLVSGVNASGAAEELEEYYVFEVVSR